MMLVGMLCLAGGLFAQGSQGRMSDFISVKKPNGRHVASYFPGIPIVYINTSGNQYSGIIEAIRHDSVFVRIWQIQSYYTSLGTTKVDTAGYYINPVPFKEIKTIVPNKPENWRFVRNGSIFMIGGIGYGLLNVINGAYLHQPITDPDNLRSLGIAAGVAGGGFILNRLYRKKHRDGKQYKIDYVRMSDQF